MSIKVDPAKIDELSLKLKGLGNVNSPHVTLFL